MTDVRQREAVAGSSDDQDARVTVRILPRGEAISVTVIDVEGKEIPSGKKAWVEAILRKLHLKDASVEVIDNDAKKFTVEARVETAVKRAQKS